MQQQCIKGLHHGFSISATALQRSSQCVEFCTCMQLKKRHSIHEDRVQDTLCLQLSTKMKGLQNLYLWAHSSTQVSEA